MELLTSKDSVFSLVAERGFPKNFSDEFSTSLLRDFVNDISFPRHYVGEASANLEARKYIEGFLTDNGWVVETQGEYDNIVAILPSRLRPRNAPVVIGATHYDSVPGCPGADDNGSGIAVLLAAAKALPKRRLKKVPVLIFFNREEDGLMGSFEFVKEKASWLREHVECAHIMEMVGYTSNEQTSPPGLPVDIGRVGDFLGVVSDANSASALKNVIAKTAEFCPELISKGIAFPEGVETIFHDVLRSDHYPFWEADIPALMWTDTANFRNNNYHLSSDTPETLDYDFMFAVTKLFASLFL